MTSNFGKYIEFLMYVVVTIFVMTSLSFSQIMTVNGNTAIHLKQGAIMSVRGGLDLKSGTSITHDNAGVSNLYISGKFNYLGTYTQGTFGILRFFGNLQDTLAGNSLTVKRLWITKTGAGNMLTLAVGTNLIIENALRLVSNHRLNIHNSDLTLEAGAMIYPDSVSTYTSDPLTDPFTNNKHISTSGKVVESGTIMRKLTPVSGLNSDVGFRFPIGTPNDTTTPTARYYTPVRYVFNKDNNTIFGAGSYLTVRCIASEHPKTEVKEVALKKYWQTNYNNIIVEPEGYNIRFNYNDNEVQGFEELYLLTIFFRPDDYYLNPGLGYGVEPINNRFYVDEVNKKDTLGQTQLLLDGDWTAGQEEAISTFYYSRKDGNWEDPDTWSKQEYSGAASPNVPTSQNDKVFIGNGRTVTLNNTTAEINRTKIENTGRLLIPNQNAQVLGDTLYLEAGGTLAISNEDGFHTSGNFGHIRTLIRSYSSDANYEFIGSLDQVTGPGIPDIVRSVIVDKSDADAVVSLTKSILIKNTLRIDEGKYHLFLNGNFTSDGETGDTTNRNIIMNGGELICQSFPTKYKNGNFTAGTINFGGTGSFRVPSSQSPSPGEPAVTQYHNLKFSGSRGANTFVTLDPTGQIRIGGQLDISGLSFNPNPLSERFTVTGSKVVFNGAGDQTIPTGYAAPVGINYRLKFHDLIIDGTGEKSFADPNDDNPANDHVLVRSLVNIKNGTLKSNNHWIKVLGNWTAEAGSTFEAGTGLVTFEADGKVTNITSNGTSFYDMRIMGTLANGFVNFTDNLNIAGDLEINPNSLRSINNSDLSIQGNWTNEGVFVANQGRVIFNGTSNQNLIHNGSGNFYNLTVNKSSNHVLLDGPAPIKVTNNLELTQGNIGGRNSVVVTNKPIVVDGTITRPGGTPGHVDGRLRLPTTENANSITFNVGIGNDYNPVKLDITGPGGAPGYLDAYVLAQADVPNLNNTVIAAQVPNGPELDINRNIQKAWVLRADDEGSQLFELAPSRTIDLEFFFLSSDIRVGATPAVFEIGQREGETNTGNWSKPFLEARNALSTKLSGSQNFDNDVNHYFMLGDPQIFTYYSIDDGDFNDPEIWSTAGYTSIEPATRAPISNDNIRIGNGKTVTLNVDHSVNSGRLFVVETGAPGYENGHLIFDNDTRLITGAGTFRLDSGAAITIRHADGIVNAPTASGAVRTTTRQYNFNNHNSGRFIYARTGAGNQNTGNGLPLYVWTFQVDRNANGDQVIFTNANTILHVRDSIHIRRGNVQFTNINTKIGGNFIVELNGQYNFGTQATNQGFNSLGPPPASNTGNSDSVSVYGGLMFDGVGEQFIWVKRADTNQVVNFNRISLIKQTGRVISRNNIDGRQLFFHLGNRTNFDGKRYNKWFNAITNVIRVGTSGTLGDPGFDSLEVATYGYVEGRLVRPLTSQRIWPVGSETKYAPVQLAPVSISGDPRLIEVQVSDGNHPKFNINGTQINSNTNIQRYYEITRTVDPASSLNMNNGSISVRLIITQDEPRGGINPNDYVVFRLQSNDIWTNTTSISSYTGGDFYNNSTNRSVRVNTPNPLPGNDIFSTDSEFSDAPSITLMIGEPLPVTPERIFYSRNSGLWDDPETWSWVSTAFENTEDGYALNSNPGDVYPQYHNGPFRDIVYIGAGDSVYFNLNNVSIRYLMVEETVSGTGILVMPPNNNNNNSVINTEQYVQKNGGKLYIGHRRGITDLAFDAANQGSIRRISATSILNYDWNSLGKNNFAFIGVGTTSNDNVQQTGNGLPNTIGSLTIDYNRTADNRYVDLTNDANLIIKDSLVFINGRFRNRGGDRTVTVKGDIVNYSSDVGFHNLTNPSNRAIILDSTNNQQIRGTTDLTAFPSTLQINKPSGTVTFNRNATLNGTLDVLTNTFLNVADSRTLIFGENATINNLDSFRVNRMIKVSGGPSTGKLRKLFASGTNQNRSFRFPVGDDSLGTRRYGEARFELNNMDFAAGSFLEFSLRRQYPHPEISGTPNMLSKYWSVSTSGITRNSGTMNTRLRYNDSEVNGNILNYKPALYRRPDVEPLDPGWSSTIFAATNLQIDTTNKFIIVDNAQTLPNHDWTAGNPQAFASGKIYYSRSNGNWTNPNTWTNITNSGVHDAGNVPALNYPGFYANDIVFIGADHVVNYNRSVENPVDSVSVGISSPSTSPELQFVTSASSNKALNIRGSLMIGSTGLLSKSNALFNSIDTIRIRRDLSNLGTGLRGINIHPGVNQNIRLEFNGNDSTRILGEGTYTSLGNVRIIKADSVWNTINESASFSSAFSTAVTTIPTVDFDLDAGMYVHDVDADITLSTDDDGDVFLGDLVGLVVRDGNIIFEDGLICGQNASVWLINGNMTVGNQKDENFQYESVTIIDFAGNSELNIAGSMRRRFTTSNVDFRIKDNAKIELMIHGATTNSAERRAAFDFGEANSKFSMTGNSRVKINRPMELSPSLEKDPDYLVLATDNTVTGGTVEFGDLLVNPVDPEPFNLIASVPFWNLDIINTHGNELSVGSPIVTVRNDMFIRSNGKFNQNGNNLNIGGDFTIIGQYKPGNLGTRRVSFFGNPSATPATKFDQTIRISSNDSEPFYNVAISKADSGRVILSNDPAYLNSNLLVSNTLEFSVGNRGVIETGDDRYVQVGLNNTDLASIQRFGGGHVNGFLRRWINNGVQERFYPVGVNRYTPVTIQTTSGVGDEGTLSVRAFNTAHPDIAAAISADILQPGTFVDRYWQIKPLGTSPFALGDRTFSLTTQFVKGSTPTGDVKPGSNFGIFEHFRRTPEWNNAGNWFSTPDDNFTRTDSSTTSRGQTAYGDYVIAEAAGERFFSYASGDWNVSTNWRMGSYTSDVLAIRAPDQESDRVFIGNGHTITIQNSSPRVRSVTVEEFEDKPGKLVILDERFLRGLSFTLNDNCFLATDDAFGFTSVSGPTPNIGAIRATSIRSYGLGTYEYIGEQGQAMGDGPVNSKTIIVNNSGTVTNSVSFSPFTYTIQDTILIQNGGLSMGTGLVNLKGNMILNDGKYVLPNTATLNLNGTSDQYFVIDDSSGINVYNLRLSKTAGNLFLKGSADSASLSIIRNLTFETGNVAYISGRSTQKRVILSRDTSTITRTGSGHIDGYLLKQTVGSGTNTFKYELGFGSLYLPATLLITAGDGVSGLVAGKVDSPPNISVARIDPDKKINYYWTLAPWADFSLGDRKANTTFEFPSSQITNLTGGVPNTARLLRKSIPVEAPLWSQRIFSELNWSVGVASVNIANSNDYWIGLGEFYIGEKLAPTFYSRQSGNWNDHTTWTYENTHIGPEISLGEYPNPDPENTEDNVFIGLDHIVTLNVATPQIDTLIVRHDSKLDMLENVINCASCLTPLKGLFDLRDNATIAFGGINIPSTSTTITNFANYVMNPLTTTIEYTGTQTITPTPFSPFFSKYPGNLRISGVGNKLVNVPVTVDANVIVDENSNLEIDANSLQVKGNVINSGSIFNQKVIEIGE